MLVVDDEESMRHMLTLVLKKAGYKVKAVGDGEQALKELLAHTYDMALCDIRMPKLDGHGLLREIRVRSLQVTVIMMSAYGDVETALHAIKEGAYDYIPKPFKKDEVLLTLQKAEEREHLRRENRRLKEEQREQFSFSNIIGKSPAMKRVFDTVRKVAAYKTTVLLGGESGTGKELLARALHSNSNRADKPWIPINCGAIPENLLESELFGHTKGAFTDATADKPGLFQRADGGTLFLDEVAELPLNLQVKLLRVLQEGEVRRVGDTLATPVDVRIVAASARNIETLVKEGTFRKDLFYRLNVLTIHLPPLRERREDLPLLIQHFIQRHN
ncbi:MAG: sigma-54 dependent transcriptional regulator, partial [Myxococcota bacterium]